MYALLKKGCTAIFVFPYLLMFVAQPIALAKSLNSVVNETAATNGATACNKTVYLTFDTGNMSVADVVADILARQNVKATFFLANEKTDRGDFSLDDSWKKFWQDRYLEGHHFGAHTFNHDYFVGDAPSGGVYIRPQFGPSAGKVILYKPSDFCLELNKVNSRFEEITGHSLERIWRAPGGNTSPRLISIAKQCGFSHTSWAAAGFLGDELNSREYSNEMLLKRASFDLQDGDIAMAHLGIWSRKDVWAPAVLEPLIINLKRRGFCFGLLP